MKFSLVIPFHKDVQKLLPTLERVESEMQADGVVEVLLCHNGPVLSSFDLEMVNRLCSEKIKYFHTDAKGIGAGYKLGIQQSQADFVILSASDLPFGWTDLQAFRALTNCEFAIGSKAHPQSSVGNITLKRRIASFGFLVLRRLILGRKTPQDSQGSLIIKTSLARELAHHCIFNHYLFSLEIASHFLKKGGSVVEVPVVLENNDGESSVSVVGDGWKMFKDLLRLRDQMNQI